VLDKLGVLCGARRFQHPVKVFGLCHRALVVAALVPQTGFGLVRIANAQTVKITDSRARVVITDDARAKAGDIFRERCAACHGDDGRGNGPAASNLKPKPIDFHNRNWQHSVTNDSITKAIIFGGRAVGRSGQMAPNPDLENEPAIVAALVDQIRQWGQ
jgi:mono/diheme cytochrome c family protein